jgi:outer membrane lipoprotein SlyB
MKMKKTFVAVAVATSLAISGCQSTTTALDPTHMTMNKRLASMERAVVLMADAVKVKPSQLNAGTKAGMGLVAAGAGTAAMSNHRNSANIGAAVAVAGLATMVFSAMSDQPVDAIRYTLQNMKTNQMNEVVQVTPKDTLPFAQNTPVLLKRYTDGSAYIFKDVTQNMTFTKAKATSFEGDAEVAKAKAEALATIKAKADTGRAKAQAELDEREKFNWEQQKRRIEAETSIQETHSKRTDDKIDAAIGAVKEINKHTITIKTDK